VTILLDMGVLSNEYSCAHGAKINFVDITAHLTYGWRLGPNIYLDIRYYR
jgi:hypothetical protein